MADPHYITLGKPVTAPDGSAVSGIRIMPAYRSTPAVLEEGAEELYNKAPATAGELMRLNPAIRFHVLEGIADIYANGPGDITLETPRRGNIDPAAGLNPAAHFSNGTELMGALGLSVKITSSNQEAVDRAMLAAGLVKLGDEPGLYAISSNPNEAYAYNDMPYFEPHGPNDNDFRVLPGSFNWPTLNQQRWRLNSTGQDADAYLADKFGIDTTKAVPVPLAAASAPSTTPSTTRPQNATGFAAAFDPAANGFIPNNATAPAGTDRWADNGLIGLGILSGANDPERDSKITAYLTSAGLTPAGKNGSFTADQLKIQLEADVKAWQQHLKATPTGYNPHTEQPTGTRAYDLGTYGDNKDGIDGKFGSKTAEATLAYLGERGIAARPIDIIRPELSGDSPTVANPLTGPNPLPYGLTATDRAFPAIRLEGVTTDGETLTSGIVPEGAATTARALSGPTRDTAAIAQR